MTSQSDIFSLIDAQNEIVDYWNSRRQSGVVPLRSDMDPGALRAHLHCISILELDGQGGATFRLIGTQLRNLIGADMRGCHIDELPDEYASIWRMGGGLPRPESCQPDQGVVDLGESHHAWLRLPLRHTAADETPSMVLCHDILRRKKTRMSRPVFSLHPLASRAVAA
ncbi:MAG: PAS domain-containing protein [Henriciella sp.]|nr:PAS domain-containing protein [Henriciella sp.]